MNRILIIAPVLSARNLLTDILEVAGYNVAAAPDCESALGILTEFRPHLIIIDFETYEVRSTHGWDRLALLQRDPAIPIIFVCDEDYSGVGSVVRAQCADYVTRPFDPDQILSPVKNQIELRRLRQELHSARRKSPLQSGDQSQSLGPGGTPD